MAPKDIEGKAIAEALLAGNTAAIEVLENSGLEIDGELIDALTSALLPLNILQRISESSWWELPVALLGNPNLPKDMLRNMLQKPNSGIYHYEVQQAFLLSDSEHKDIYEDILNGKTAGIWSHLELTEKQRRKEILVSLNRDNRSDREVGSSLALLLEEVGEIERARSVWENAFGSAPAGSEIELLDSEDSNFLYLRDLALHPLTNKRTLLKLSFSDDEELEGFVAANPSTPPCVIAYYAESLYANGEPYSLVLKNPRVPSYVWPWFVAEFSQSQSVSWEPHQLLVSAAAANHGIPLDLMGILSSSELFRVRNNLFNNPCVPQEIKEKISLSE